MPLSDSKNASAVAPPAAAVVPKMVSLKVVQTATASGEGTISVAAGMMVQAEPKDYGDTSTEWLWVIPPNGAPGYIPREFVGLA